MSNEPTNPADCLKAGFCQSRAECHCEKTINEDRWGSPEVQMNKALAIGLICGLTFWSLVAYLIWLCLQ
jgi:hypothetical protein